MVLLLLTETEMTKSQSHYETIYNAQSLYYPHSTDLGGDNATGTCKKQAGMSGSLGLRI